MKLQDNEKQQRRWRIKTNSRGNFSYSTGLRDLESILLSTIFLITALLALLTIDTQQSFQQQQQQKQDYYYNNNNNQQQQTINLYAENKLDDAAAPAVAVTTKRNTKESVLPPPELRPEVRVNIREWTSRLSDEIRLVANRTSCTHKIAQSYQLGRGDVQYQRLEPTKLRDSVLVQINSLLNQHKAALNAIVSAAEEAASRHKFHKELRVNYTDVHRLRNELESQQAQLEQELAQQQLASSAQPTMTSGMALTTGSQSTSISGGTPVPGPPEWQPWNGQFRSIIMQVNKNFGDIPVNTSMSAVHLPLPIYSGLPEIMNSIAWTEQLDKVFRANLNAFAHVHHQYYGDRLGLLRTFPAHKWRIPKTEPDLFDARTRPWYIAGAASPKDVVILVDTSGSMTGLRREIAKGVVFELLDTLTINDHFAVMRFAETVTPMGLPRCANLRQPHRSIQLEAECPAMYHPHHSAAAAASAPDASRRYVATSPTDMGGAGGVECANFRRQWETRGQYLRDHPDWDPTSSSSNNNNSNNQTFHYMTDDAYRRSIVNVTGDIRDAYLLPATSRNIRYLKSNFTLPTAGIANFTHALMAAFELLQSYNRTNDLGSQCQQAIMLITDGAIKSHEEVFNRYNYPNAPVRMFTYMIGREVGNIRPTKEMACRNRGYYAHVINLSEIREQVQKYLPVMARPLVLAQHHPITWTNAYGDETYQVLTDWVLEIKRRERARILLNEEREKLSEGDAGADVPIELTNIAEYDELAQVDELLGSRFICEDAPRTDNETIKALEQSLEGEVDPLGYNDLACHWTTRRADLLTSVVKPVFDQKNTSLFFERILSKNVWTEKETHVRNAQLLGVAAVDLRINDILKAIPSHLLGPNGYAILLGQNGFIMHHPDHRALLEDPYDKQSKILKPYFNVVDLMHLEQVHHRNELGAGTGGAAVASLVAAAAQRRRSEDIKLLKLREAAIRKATGQETITVKRAIDCRRRPHVRQQLFYYGPVKDTPYSLMLVLPKSYGLNRLQAKLSLSKTSQTYFSPSEYDLFTVHPEYRYCERLGFQDQAYSQNESLNALLDLFRLVANEANDGSGANNQLDDIPLDQVLEFGDLSAISESSPSSNRGKLNSMMLSKLNNHHQQHQQQQQRNSPNKFICDKELFPSLLFDAKATYEATAGSAACCPSMPSSSSSSYYYSPTKQAEPTCDSSPEEMR